MTSKEFVRKLKEHLAYISAVGFAQPKALYIGYSSSDSAIESKITALAEEIESFMQEDVATDSLHHIDFDDEYPFYRLMAEEIAEEYAGILVQLKDHIDGGNLAYHMEFEGHEGIDGILSYLHADQYTANLEDGDYSNKRALEKKLKENILMFAADGMGVDLDDFDSDMNYLDDYISESDGFYERRWRSGERDRFADAYQEHAEGQARENLYIGLLEEVFDYLDVESDSFSLSNVAGFELDREDFPFTKKEFLEGGQISLCLLLTISDTSLIEGFLQKVSKSGANILLHLAVLPRVAGSAIASVKDYASKLKGVSFGKVILLYSRTVLARAGMSLDFLNTGERFDLGQGLSVEIGLYDSIHISLSAQSPDKLSNFPSESGIIIDVDESSELQKKLKVSVFSLSKSILESPRNYTNNINNIFRPLVTRELSGQDFSKHDANILYLESSPTMSLNLFSFTNKDSVSSHYLSLMGSFGQLSIKEPMAVDAQTYLAGGKGLEEPLSIVIPYPISREDAHLLENKRIRLYVINQQNFGVAENAFAPISKKQAYSVNITNKTFENSDIDTNTLNIKQVSPRYNKEYINNNYEEYDKIASIVGGAFFKVKRPYKTKTAIHTKDWILTGLYGYQKRLMPDTQHIYTVKPKKGSNFISIYYTSYYVGLVVGRFEEHAHKKTSILLVNPLTMVLDSLFYHYTGETVSDPLSVYVNRLLPFLVENGATALIQPESSADILPSMHEYDYALLSYTPIFEVLRSYTDELTRPFALLFAAINVQDYATRSNPYVEEGDFVGSILTKKNNTVGHYLESVSMATLDFSSSSRSWLGTLATDGTIITRETKLSEVQHNFLERELEVLSKEPCIAAYHSIQNIDSNIFVKGGNERFAPKGDVSFFSKIDSDAFDFVREGYSHHVPPRVLGEYQLYSDNTYDVSMYDALAQRNMYYTFEFFAKKTSVILDNWNSGYFSSSFKERVAGKVGGKVDGTLVNLTSVFETYHCAEALRKVWSNRNKKVNLDGNRVSKNVVATQKKAMPYLLIEEVLKNTNGIEQGATAPTPMQYAVILELMSATYETIFNQMSDFGTLVAKSGFAKLYAVTEESGRENVVRSMKSMSAKGGSICIGQYTSYQEATIAGRTETFTLDYSEEGLGGVITVNKSQNKITEAKGYNNENYGSSRETRYDYEQELYDEGSLKAQAVIDAANAIILSMYFDSAHGKDISGMQNSDADSVAAFFDEELDTEDACEKFYERLGEAQTIFYAALCFNKTSIDTINTNILLFSAGVFDLFNRYFTSFLPKYPEELSEAKLEEIKSGISVMVPANPLEEE